MYDNARVPSRPCRVQYSRWSLDAPTTETVIGQSLPQPSATLSSSLYYPSTRQSNQLLAPHYVNYYPSSSATHLPNEQRPKSTIVHSFSSAHGAPLQANDFRPRYESKPLVGIVKPMVHQRSATLNHDMKLLPEKWHTPASHHHSTRSLHPQPTSTSPPPSATSSIIYRARPAPSYNNISGQPPMAPRRHSSIGNGKCLSSYRSSRTTSTSSSVAAVNELSSAISSYENEQQQQQQQLNDGPIIDVKRLEMFYGSVGTLVKSAHCIARLYATTTRQLANFEDWSCQQVGVPVWIYNTVRLSVTAMRSVRSFSRSFPGRESEAHATSTIAPRPARQLFCHLVGSGFRKRRVATAQGELHHLLAARIESSRRVQIRTRQRLPALLPTVLRNHGVRPSHEPNRCSGVAHGAAHQDQGSATALLAFEVGSGETRQGTGARSVVGIASVSQPVAHSNSEKVGHLRSDQLRTRQSHQHEPSSGTSAVGHIDVALAARLHVALAVQWHVD